MKILMQLKTIASKPKSLKMKKAPENQELLSFGLIVQSMDQKSNYFWADMEAIESLNS